MWAKHIWTTLVGLQVAAIAVAVELLLSERSLRKSVIRNTTSADVHVMKYTCRIYLET